MILFGTWPPFFILPISCKLKVYPRHFFVLCSGLGGNRTPIDVVCRLKKYTSTNKTLHKVKQFSHLVVPLCRDVLKQLRLNFHVNWGATVTKTILYCSAPLLSQSPNSPLFSSFLLSSTYYYNITLLSYFLPSLPHAVPPPSLPLSPLFHIQFRCIACHQTRYHSHWCRSTTVTHPIPLLHSPPSATLLPLPLSATLLLSYSLSPLSSLPHTVPVYRKPSNPMPFAPA